MADEQESLNVETLREIAGDESPPLGQRVMAFATDPNAMFTVISDAAASEAEAENADSQGNLGKDTEADGLVTAEGQNADFGKAEGETAADSNSQESEESEEGKKGITQRTKEERIEDLVAKEVEKRLAEFNARQAENTPDFAGPEVVKAVKRNILKWQTEADALRNEIDLEGDEAADDKIDKLLALQDTISEARKALKDNEAKQKAWEQRQAKKNTQSEVVNERLAKLDQTAEFYRQEKKIDKATWDKMGTWFADQCHADKTVGAEFAEKVEREGLVAAVRWAHDYTVKNMGKETKQKNEQREETKTKASVVTSTATGKAAPINIEKFRKAYAEDPGPETFAALQEAKRKAQEAA